MDYHCDQSRRENLTIVELNVEDHRVLIHRVLQERIPAEFLNPSKHSLSLIKSLERCREHLATDRPLVTRAQRAGQYYVACHVFAVIMRKHQWAAFDQMAIHAIEVELSDDEVENMFWAKVRLAFSLHKVCDNKGISIFHIFGDRLAEQTKRRPKNEVKDFNSLIDSFNEYRELDASNNEDGSDQLDLWSLKR